MGLKNEKQGVCFVRFSLLTCQNTKKLVKNVLTWQIFPQKQTKKVPEFARGGLKKGIHYSDFCPISGKFLTINWNLTKKGVSRVWEGQNLPDIGQIPCKFWPISGKFPHVSCNIRTYTRWLIYDDIWQISSKFSSWKKLPNSLVLSSSKEKDIWQMFNPFFITLENHKGSMVKVPVICVRRNYVLIMAEKSLTEWINMHTYVYKRKFWANLLHFGRKKKTPRGRTPQALNKLHIFSTSVCGSYEK